MAKPKNSALLSSVIKAIYTVASRRTTSKFADETVGSTIRTLENKYDFLKYVKINKDVVSDSSFAISVSKEVDSIHPTRIGKAIESILRVIYNDMNEEAGLYFVSELKECAGDAITKGIINCEVDLDQVQTEQHYAYRRRERKKSIKKAVEQGKSDKDTSDNLLGYTWKNVSSWKHDTDSKYCTLYDKQGNVVDRLNLDRIIQNYVEKLSGFTDTDPSEIEKQTRIYEKEYMLLKLLLERDMDAENAMNVLDVSHDELNNMIKKLSEMEMLQYVSYDTIELTKMGIGFISENEKPDAETGKD